jgi:hypothetical protein
MKTLRFFGVLFTLTAIIIGGIVIRPANAPACSGTTSFTVNYTLDTSCASPRIYKIMWYWHCTSNDGTRCWGSHRIMLFPSISYTVSITCSDLNSICPGCQGSVYVWLQESGDHCTKYKYIGKTDPFTCGDTPTFNYENCNWVDNYTGECSGNW